MRRPLLPTIRSRLFLLMLVGIGSLTAFVSCKEKAKEEGAKSAAKAEGVDVELTPKALEAARLKTGKATRLPKRAVVVASGLIDFAPSRVARVGPSIPGRVGRVIAVTGQKVGRGALLVTVESAELGRAQADYAQSKARLAQTNAEVEREKRLVGVGASSERALIVAETDKGTAEADLRAAQQRLSTLGLGGESGGGGAPLTSPLAGTVLEVRARVGQPVGPTDTLVVVGETAQVWLAIDVYERDVGKVKIGDDVKVVTIAYPDRTFTGKVDQVGAALDAERHVLEIRVILDNPDGLLKPGMTATARVFGTQGNLAEADGGDARALFVPKGAVIAVDGAPFVFVEHEPGKYEMRAIERGDESEDGVEVKRGLKGDETLVVEGTFMLKSEALKAQMGSND